MINARLVDAVLLGDHFPELNEKGKTRVRTVYWQILNFNPFNLLISSSPFFFFFGKNNKINEEREG